MPRMLFGWVPARMASWIVTTVLGVGLCHPVFAQRPAPAGDGPKPIRPAGEDLRVEKVPDELLKILKDWELSSAKVKKMDGEHIRMEYDYVFGILKRNLGKFYYEAPDKGRIDLNPDTDAAKLVKGKPPTVDKKHWQTGKPVTFKIQAGQSERWICNGKFITQVDDVARTALQMVIPQQNQGERIMDGPLPFLFGMPTDKALRRFELSLVGVEKQGDRNIATIRAKPRWRSDAANYQLAQINLNLSTFLPEAVRLIDPAGTKETVFVFKDVQANARRIAEWFGAKPFEPNLKSYKIVVQHPGDDHVDQDPNDKRVVPAGATKSPEKPSLDDRPSPTEVRPLGPPKQRPNPTKVAVPSVIDLDWKQARKSLEDLGFTVKLIQGSTAKRTDQVFRVEQQEPDPKTQLAPGETVTLWLFTKPKSAAQE